MLMAARGLKASGHGVFLGCRDGSRLLREAEGIGIPAGIFNVRADFSPLNTLRIGHFLKREGIEVLVCNLNRDVLVAGLAARLVGTPVVVARHGVKLCGQRWRYKVFLTRLLDGIITNSESVKRGYDGYNWFENGFVRVIYNGVEDKSGVRPYPFSRRFPGKKIVFSAGRLVRQKGFDLLIRSAEMLAERRDDLVFLVAGTGPLEGELKDHVKRSGLEGSFHFLGYLEDIDPYMKGCDLFVLASLYEGMPNVVMEAMAAGRAIVATDVDGVRELVEDGKTGVIVPPGDERSLAGAIDKLMDTPALVEAYGENGRKRVVERFPFSAMIANLEEYLDGLLSEKNRGQVD